MYVPVNCGMYVPLNCGMYVPLSDDEHQWSETAQKNALASVDVIVTQLLHYHLSLLYFVCNHLIVTQRGYIFLL